MKTKLFFDLDNTLARSRTKIEPEMKELLLSHMPPYEYVVISGAEPERIFWQIDGLAIPRLAVNGNDSVDKDGALLWKNELTEAEKVSVRDHVEKLKEYFNVEVSNPEDLLEDRSSQMCYSVIGHNEDLDKKHAFDPDASKRKEALIRIPFISDTVEVVIGGTTTFDYFKKGHHKGTNIARFIALKGWDKSECVYFGDRLHPGGNDEPVIGVIDTIPVEDHHDTFAKLKELFG